jgi:hypothetical protein
MHRRFIAALPAHHTLTPCSAAASSPPAPSVTGPFATVLVAPALDVARARVPARDERFAVARVARGTRACIRRRARRRPVLSTSPGAPVVGHVHDVGQTSLG